MRKSVLLALCAISINYAFGQQAAAPSAYVQKYLGQHKHTSSMSMMAIDTLDQYYQRATGFYIYGNQGGGYVYGTAASSGFAISDAVACHFDGIGNANVTDVLLWCAAKEIVGTDDSLAVSIYSVNPDTSTNALLGSTTIGFNDLDTTSGNFTAVPVNAAITAEFLAALEYAGTDDTFGLVCSSPLTNDGMGEKRARILLTASFGGGWMAINDVYGTLDADVMIIPVVDISTGMSQFETKNYLLKPVYPSPAKDFITLDYTLKNSAPVQYTIIDRSGKNVLSKVLGVQDAGQNSKRVNISGLASGNYYITFRAGGVDITQKFTIIK